MGKGSPVSFPLFPSWTFDSTHAIQRNYSVSSARLKEAKAKAKKKEKERSKSNANAMNATANDAAWQSASTSQSTAVAATSATSDHDRVIPRAGSWTRLLLCCTSAQHTQ